MRVRTRRFAALGLDYLVILAWMIFLGVVSTVIYLVRGALPDTLGTIGPLGSELLYFLLLTFVVGIYLYRTEAGPHHASWGKVRMGLVVTDAQGAAPKRTQILSRTIVKLLPWETAHFFIWQMMYVFYLHGHEATPPLWVFVGLNAASTAALTYIVLVAATGRGPHDAAAGTEVRLRRVPDA